MAELPAPLTPPDCDLRDFPWMPVDITRLFNSEFHALSDDTTWRSGFTLWLKSYHQVPAASLPEDDVALARLAEHGRDVKAWRKVKAKALRGWVLCSDGRFYHPTVSEKALEAWIDKLTQRRLSAAGNATRHGTVFDSAPFDEAVRDSLTRLAALNPNSRALGKRFVRATAKRPAGTPADLQPGADMPLVGSENGSRRELDGIPLGASEAPVGTEKTSHPGPAGAPVDLPLGSQENRTERNPPMVPLKGDLSPAPPKASRGTLLPADWTPKPKHYERAAQAGCDRAWVDRKADDMRTWAKANSNRAVARKADWDATFDGWLRRDLPNGGPILFPPGGGRAPALGIGIAPRPTSGTASMLAGMDLAEAAILRRSN